MASIENFSAGHAIQPCIGTFWSLLITSLTITCLLWWNFKRLFHRVLGSDSLSYQKIRHNSSASAFLWTLFNRIWLEGIFPLLWQQAFIVPIPKTGKDPHLAAKHLVDMSTAQGDEINGCKPPSPNVGRNMVIFLLSIQFLETPPDF